MRTPVMRPRAAFLLAAAAAFVTLGALACHDVVTAPGAESDEQAGSWGTWVLASGSSLRPVAPAAVGTTDEREEVAEVLRRQASRTAATDSAVQRWRSPTAQWDSLALRTLDFYFPLLPEVRIATPVRAARVMALLHVAAYDALVATWDAKYAYRRPSPADADARVARLADTRGVPGYPNEQAAVAAAASAVLTYLFPAEDTARFRAMAQEAGDSRIAAGAASPSDVAAGLALGRAVAERVIARARADGSDVPWAGATPTSPGTWRPTPKKYTTVPFDAGAGSWRPWVLARGDEYRPLPPPAPGSAAFERDLAELRTLSTARTAAQTELARYWSTDAPSVIWEKDMLRELQARQLPPVRAARMQALASVAMYDAFVACWDGKFHYWLERPVTADTSVRTVFSSPPFPSYPSGHSTISSAAGEVFAALFPDRAAHYRDRALEASLSRVYGGVHYRFDVEAGDILGSRVGRAVMARAASDHVRP